MKNRIIQFDPPLKGTDYGNQEVEILAIGYWPEINTREFNDLGYTLDDITDDVAEQDLYRKYPMVSVKLDGSGLERATSCLYLWGEMGVEFTQDDLFKALNQKGIIGTG